MTSELTGGTLAAPERVSVINPEPTEDRERVERLLGRRLNAEFAVAVRDAVGAPVVIRNAPFMDDGTPMPTLYWLVGAAECDAVARLEAAGGVREAERSVDPNELIRAHERYAAERDVLVFSTDAGPCPTGGVGGTRRGVKCLHAHLAWYLAGGEDPVGAWVASSLGLDRSVYAHCR